MPDAMDTLLARYIDELAAREPVAASMLGIDGHDGALPDLTAHGIRETEEWADEWAARLGAVPDADLSPAQRIDRDLVLSVIRGDQIRRDWAEWKRQPAAYLDPACDGVFILFLHASHPEDELAAAAIARMQGAAALLAAGKENLDASLVPPVFAERAVAQCEAAITYMRELVAEHVTDPASRDRMAEAGEEAARAYEDFLDFLRNLHADARGSYAIGEGMYSDLLREAELLGYGASEMRERGRAAYDDVAAEMRRIAKELRDTEDFITVVEDLNRDHAATPEAMREEYAEWTERARRFLIDRSLVTMPPGDRCLVVPSPHFQRPVLAVASYNPPPAFKPATTGHFFVPYPPDGVSDEEVQQRLESNSRMAIPTTAVHEAYPGHHWHLVTANLNARPVRKVHESSYFGEGWALYAELMMREEGFYDDPRHELGVLDARIFRAARIVVDTSLHIGDMDFESAVTFMRQKAGLSEPTARAEVGRYCTWPTQASSYLTGSLEIERMRARFLAERRGTLRDFHDRICGSGALPIGLAERALFD